MSDGVALELRQVTKRFGATTALDGTSFLLRRGTIHALLGENGAGKTTLMRIASGSTSADTGELVIDDRSVRFAGPAQALDHGVAMVHQHFSNIPALTVAENVALGGHGRYDRGQAHAAVRETGARVGLPLDPDALASSLSVPMQQRLEIVKAVARQVRVLVLDEPTAVLAPAEALELLHWLRTFVADGGSVVLITHKLSEALGFADDVTVLRHGRRVAAGHVAEFEARSLATAMLGAPPPAPAVAARGNPMLSDDAVAEARGVTVVGPSGVTMLHEIDVTVRAGELIGVVGVEGSGHRELLRVFAGRLQPTRGSVTVHGAIGYIPEDRQGEALILDFDLAENVALRDAGDARGVLSWRRLRERTATLLRDHDVRGAGRGVRTAARDLSGGNQQRLVLARELDARPTLIVAENPTRGLDVAAAAAVVERLLDASANGAAVLFHAADLDEVIPIATRLLVLHAGRVTELPPDRDRAGAAMLGLARAG